MVLRHEKRDIYRLSIGSVAYRNEIIDDDSDSDFN